MLTDRHASCALLPKVFGCWLCEQTEPSESTQTTAPSTASSNKIAPMITSVPEAFVQ